MGDHTFISYSRADESEVRKLYNDLIQAGVNCWLDVECIPSGANWDETLQEAIETCERIIIVCTPTSMGSQNVRAEWQYAFELNKPIHPLILKTCKVPFRLRIYQMIDASQANYDKAIKELVEAIPKSQHAPTTYVVEEAASKKVETLIQHAVMNWRSFGLLLDHEAFNHIDETRDELTELDSQALQLLFLSARRNRQSVEYWAERLKTDASALDSIETLMIDEIGEDFSHIRRSDFLLIASDSLITKIARLLSMTEDEATLQALLDSVEPVLIRKEELELNLDNLESELLSKFERTPNMILARALGWVNSTEFYALALEKLQHYEQPLSAGLDSNDYIYLHGLAYMTMQEAVDYLKTMDVEGFGYIPAGWSIIGENNPNYDFNLAHMVFIPAFWMAITPVTIEEYRLFDPYYGHTELPDDYPAHMLNWRKAKKYTHWLTERLNVPVDLPTEAMWEKAASWHPVEQRKLRFPWGDEEDYTRCNTIESKRGDFTAVSTFSPQGDSPYGIQDMIGNVWEWTASAWLPYPYHPRDGREEANTQLRVMRGTSQDAKRGYLNGCTTRISFEEDYSFDNAGFRVAIVIAQ